MQQKYRYMYISHVDLIAFYKYTTSRCAIFSDLDLGKPIDETACRSCSAPLNGEPVCLWGDLQLVAPKSAPVSRSLVEAEIGRQHSRTHWL